MVRQMIAALLAAASWAPAAQAQDGGQYGGRRMDRGDRQGGRAERQQQAQPQQPQPPAYQAPAAAQPTRPRDAGNWRQRGPGQQRVDGQPQYQAQSQGQSQGQPRTDWRQRGDQRFDRQSQGSPPRDWQARDRAGIDARAQGDRRPDVRNNDRGDGFRDRTRYGYGNAGGSDARGYGERGRTDWNRGWRGDGRYDWNGYRQNNRAAFRLPRYYAPSNWNGGYRRFSVGVTLSSLLWGQNYWIEEPDFYRLPPAYGPYRWVRYYDDALLVDIRSGYVVDTVYDIFW